MFLIRTLLCCLILCAALTAQGQDWNASRFDKDVASLLVSRCLDCHSGPKPKGKLDLSKKASTFKGGESGPAVVANDLAQSLIWQRVSAGEMPPKKKLTESELSLLKSWIESGAVWGSDPIDPFRITTDKRAGYDWWSLQPLRDVSPPKIKNSATVKNPIDAFVVRRLEDTGLTPSPQASAAVLLRRLAFGLTGLPPTPEQVAAFQKDFEQDAERAFSAAVARLLKSRHYGETWARHWLDVARFGESQGFERDKIRNNSWYYRDWVIDAFNNDMPYDEFARLQIAGDVLRPNDPDAIAATGFLVAGAYDEVGNSQSSAAMRAIVRQDELEDLVGTIGQTFLGLTVNCARCHDHKFDPIRQKEYYQLTSTMGGVRHGEREVVSQASLEKKSLIDDQITFRRAAISKLDQEVRNRLVAKLEKNPQSLPARVEPLSRWNFDKDLNDQNAKANAVQHPHARRDGGRLILDAKVGYAASHPVKDITLKEKTLEAWVKLDNLKQRGGAAISIQTPNGNTFDAIVFGEREPGKWMAGSSGFQRTQSFNGETETTANTEFVHVAITYQTDGTITGFRNGKPYGKPYKSSGLVTYAAGNWMVLLGLRHGAPAPSRQLQGAIECAQLYDKALTPKEIHASFVNEASGITQEAVLAEMSRDEKASRIRLYKQVDDLIREQAKFKPHKVYSVTTRVPETAHLLIRGNPATVGEPVAAGGVAAVVGPNANFGLKPNSPDADRRRKLVEWITGKRNHLFARVMVNRVWHYHFGAGLVQTPNDFGFNGGRPSHPDLIDWLAKEFIKSGYSIKQLHRLIVNSATYRQASLHRADCAKVDAGNRLLWRRSPQRLTAEAVRDSILAVAGQLNRQYGGPPYRDFTTFTRNTQFYNMIDPVGEPFNRRTIYRTWLRSGRSLFLDVFDCPDPSTTAPKRAVTTTPSQSLSLLNNSFVLRMSKHFAERAEADAENDQSAQISRVLELAYSRQARDDETVLAAQFVKQHGLAAFCRVVFNTNEFLYVD
jgi:cell division protein FtsB